MSVQRLLESLSLLLLEEVINYRTLCISGHNNVEDIYHQKWVWPSTDSVNPLVKIWCFSFMSLGNYSLSKVNSDTAMFAWKLEIFLLCAWFCCHSCLRYSTVSLNVIRASANELTPLCHTYCVFTFSVMHVTRHWLDTWHTAMNTLGEYSRVYCSWLRRKEGSLFLGEKFASQSTISIRIPMLCCTWQAC